MYANEWKWVSKKQRLEFLSFLILNYHFQPAVHFHNISL